MNENPNPTAVISPILALLKSRKAMAALIGAILNLVIVFVPSLEPHRADLLTISMILTTVLASVLIASIAKEDAAEKSAPAPGTMSAAMSVTSTPAPTSTPEQPAPSPDEDPGSAGWRAPQPYDAPGYSPPKR